MRTLSPFNNAFLSDFNDILQDTLGIFGQAASRDDYQIFSTPEGWAIRTDLPGFEKSELSLHFEDNALHLKAEKAEGSNSRRPTIEHRFALGDEVDTGNISAKLVNGELQIELPKKEVAETNNQIEIS